MIPFLYEDDNNIVVNSSTGAELFSNYITRGYNLALCPVPYSAVSYRTFRSEDTEELGLDGNIYRVSYFHNGFIMEIEKI